MISLRDIGKSFDGGASWAIRHLDLEIARGELLALLGESGCGKTTTLKMLNRLVEPTEGTIVIANEDVTGVDPVQLRRSVGYVFQGIGLFPHMTVAENVGIVPRLLGWPESDREARVDELLGLVGLDPAEYRDRRPARMSGGQRQRVGVARALAARPDILLMDEPFGALDPLTRDSLQKEVRRIHGELGLTTVLVTHDIVEALVMADRIAVMDRGVIAQIGTTRELLEHPASEFVAQLMAKPREQARVIDDILERAT